MAEPTIVTDFVGGPCDGLTKRIVVSALATGVVRCGTADYIVQGITPTHYRATFEPDTRNLGPGSPLQGTPQFNQAWTAVMHTLAFKVPAYLKRQEVAMRRIRKAVR